MQSISAGDPDVPQFVLNYDRVVVDNKSGMFPEMPRIKDLATSPKDLKNITNSGITTITRVAVLLKRVLLDLK